MPKVTYGDGIIRELPVMDPKELEKINRYKKFAQLCLTTGNSTEAAFQTYECKDRVVAKAMGNKLRKKPIVQKYMIEAAENTGITEDYILNGIKGIADNDKLRPADRLKAFELMGKTLSLFNREPKQSLKINIDLNDEEISKILGTDTKAISGEPPIVRDVDVS